MLFFWYEDRPGIVGAVGSILGTADVNIAGMQVGRREAGGEALMSLTVDSAPPQEVLERIQAEIGAHDATVVHLRDEGAGA